MDTGYSDLKKQRYRGMRIRDTLRDPPATWSRDHKLRCLRVIWVTQMCEVSWVGMKDRVVRTRRNW